MLRFDARAGHKWAPAACDEARRGGIERSVSKKLDNSKSHGGDGPDWLESVTRFDRESKKFDNLPSHRGAWWRGHERVGSLDRVSKTIRSANMARIRSAGMTPEMIVRRTTHGLGYRYRLHRHDLPGRPDMVFGRRRKIIFVHGCFWHQHVGCKAAHTPQSNVDYWLPKLARNVERDAGNLTKLKETGWQVLVIWECETKDLGNLRHKLRNFLG